MEAAIQAPWCLALHKVSLVLCHYKNKIMVDHNTPHYCGTKTKMKMKMYQTSAAGCHPVSWMEWMIREKDVTKREISKGRKLDADRRFKAYRIYKLEEFIKGEGPAIYASQRMHYLRLLLLATQRGASQNFIPGSNPPILCYSRLDILLPKCVQIRSTYVSTPVLNIERMGKAGCDTMDDGPLEKRMRLEGAR